MSGAKGKSGKQLPISIAKRLGETKYLSKKEIEKREDEEFHPNIDFSEIRIPEIIENCGKSLKKWNEILKQYQIAADEGVNVFSTIDIDCLAIYCKTYVDFEKSQNQKDIWMEEKQLSLEIINKLDVIINRHKNLLIKLQDKLFLNPLSRLNKLNAQKVNKDMDDEIENFVNSLDI